MPLKELKGLFPKLQADRKTITSAIDVDYNCAGWALNDTMSWWEPFGSVLPSAVPAYKWPKHLPSNSRLDTYLRFFAEHGFQRAENGTLERNIEKIAIYTLNGEFTHVARQLPSGRWTSKIGRQEDIEHGRPEELENEIPFGFGLVTTFLKRRVAD